MCINSMTYFLAHHTLIINEEIMVFRAFYEVSNNSIMSIISVLVPHIIVILMFGR